MTMAAVIYTFIYLSDVDECATTSNAGCQLTCVNTPGSYHCECTAGYRPTEAGRKCIGEQQLDFNDRKTTIISTLGLSHLN